MFAVWKTPVTVDVSFYPLFSNYVTSGQPLCSHGNDLIYGKVLTHSSVRSRQVTATDPHVVIGTAGHLVALTVTTTLAESEPS